MLGIQFDISSLMSITIISLQVNTSTVVFFFTGQSKELRDLLCNPHLRRLLRSVDSAESKAEAMKAAMQEPLFVEFSDQCLTIVEEENNGFTSDNDCDL